MVLSRATIRGPPSGATETARSLNIAPPGWQKTFGPLRDAFTHEHGWSRPDDPARARGQQPGHRAFVEAARLAGRAT